MLKEIRQQYGISQLGLAAMLNVSRSLLSLVELGLRDLPYPALQKLQQLQRNDTAALAISRQPIASAPLKKIEEKEKEKFRSVFTRRLAQLNYQLFLATQKLAKAEARYRNAHSALLHVSAQRITRSLVPAPFIQQVSIDALEAHAKLSLYRMPQYQLELLRIKVQLLEAEVKMVEERLNGL